MSTDDRSKSSIPLLVILGIVGIAAAYLGLFLLIFLDEFVLRTYYFSKYVPLGPQGEEFLIFIYTPLLQLIGIR